MNQGQLVRFSATFTDEGTGDLIDPSTVQFCYRFNKGVPVYLTYGVSDAVIRDSSGKYHCDVDSSISSGQLVGEWASSGEGQALGSSGIVITPAPIPALGTVTPDPPGPVIPYLVAPVPSSTPGEVLTGDDSDLGYSWESPATLPLAGGTMTGPIIGLEDKGSQVFNVMAYGAKPDRKVVTDAAITNGQATLHSSSAAFTTANVGQLACVNGAGAAGVALASTILSVTGGVATLATTASTTVTAATAAYGTDNHSAIQSAWTAAAAVGGTVLHPVGNYAIGTALVPANDVSYVGAGNGNTVITPIGNVHGISVGGSIGNQLTDLVFRDFDIDGSYQVGLAKGIFCTYMLRPRFIRVNIYNTGATGLGCDFLQDYLIEGCIIQGCGRNGTTSSPGCAGIGIGTGKYAVENGTILDCICRNNTTYGAFWENQATSTFSAGMKVIGGRYEGNGLAGIGDLGSVGMVTLGVHLVNNTGAGFYAGHSASANSAGYDGRVESCVITGNGTHGVYLDYTSGTVNGRYYITDNLVKANTSVGIKVAVSGTAPNLSITNNECIANGAMGIQTTGGTVADSDIMLNRCYSNGQSGSNEYGIAIQCGLTRCRVTLNKCEENGSGASSTQQNGIFVGTGLTLAGGEIRLNDLHGNVGNGLSLGSTPASGMLVEENVGYNPVGTSSVSITASPMTYTAGPAPETLYFIGGTMNPIQVNGITIFNWGVNAGTFTLPVNAYDSVVITYTSAPLALKTNKQ